MIGVRLAIILTELVWIVEGIVIPTDIATAPTQAEALRAVIEGRRSIGKVHAEQPPRQLIEQMLEAATWAPNHRLSEPWRFFVLAGEARNELGRFMGEQNAAKYAEGDPNREVERARGAKKALRAPVVIAVAVEPVQASNIEEVEEIEAVACAVQNMLLTAHALGLGAKWSSGAIVHSAEVKRWLGLSERAHLTGFIYVGYPAMTSERSVRTPASQLTEWRGWDDALSVEPAES
jgi:nitroreductase